MKKQQYLLRVLTVVTFLFFSSCITYLYNEHGAARPKKNRFKFSKTAFTLKPEHGIDTGAIYLTSSVMHADDAIDTTYHFCRFWTNGKMMLNYVHYNNPPNNISANDLASSNIGYYKIEEGFLYTETFVPRQGGYYLYLKWAIDSNKIIRLTRPSKTAMDTIYRTNIGELSAQPDW